MSETKRVAVSESMDSNLENAKSVEGSDLFGSENAAETMQQQSTISLDKHRAALARKHVRALNNQFASWVQLQLKDHPYELWEDGASEYISHSSDILQKFSDVVTWLKENQGKCENQDDEQPKPSSPSFKITKEDGVVVVHEVRCKLYVKSNDPADKGAWIDKGAGNLFIKCKEGADKGTKESKPIIIIRNNAGKLLLNAVLYAGIKTLQQKNAIVAIFHSLEDSNIGSVTARTFLIRTKTDEAKEMLAAAIKEYAPST